VTPTRLEADVKLEADLDLSERLFAGLMDFSRDAPGVTRAAYGEDEQRAHPASCAMSTGVPSDTVRQQDFDRQLGTVFIVIKRH